MSTDLEKTDNDVLKLDPQGYVTLPFQEDDFKEFVAGLLGKPQTIDNTIEGPFIITIDDIKNIYSLLNQRILQQNEGSLIQFNSRIVFSDSSSVLLNSIEQLLSYNEIKPLVSTEIHLTFQYLIKFKDKKVPEKQEINMSFFASKDNKKNNQRKYMDLSLPTRLIIGSINKWQNGFVQFSIKHTARTWGTDIDNLLSNHFVSFVIEDTKFRNFIRKNYASIGVTLFFGIIGSGIYFSKLVEKNIIEKNNLLLQKVFSNGAQTINNISEQLRFVAQDNLSKASDYTIIMIFISIFIAFITILIADDIQYKRKDSFILLTSEDKKNKIRQEKKYDNIWSNFFLAQIVSISCSLIASYLFVFFTRK